MKKTYIKPVSLSVVITKSDIIATSGTEGNNIEVIDTETADSKYDDLAKSSKFNFKEDFNDIW